MRTERVFNILLFLTFICTCFCLPGSAMAAKWRQVSQNSRFNILIDLDSLQPNQAGPAFVWLAFVPRTAQHRQKTADEHAKKAYRLHLELYRLNCAEQTAVHMQTELIGKYGRKLVTLPGSDKSIAILPGTELDAAFARACPEESWTEPDDTAEQATAKPLEGFRGVHLSINAQRTEADISSRISEARKKTAEAPGKASAWEELGNALFDAEMYNDAIQAYSRSLTIKPDNVDLLNDLGAAYRKSGDVFKALECHQKVLAIQPENLESLYLIGYIHAIEMNRTNEAMAPWKKYLELDSSSETAAQIRQYIEKYSK